MSPADCRTPTGEPCHSGYSLHGGSSEANFRCSSGAGVGCLNSDRTAVKYSLCREKISIW
jgi:hypothetical protein